MGELIEAQKRRTEQSQRQIRSEKYAAVYLAFQELARELYQQFGSDAIRTKSIRYLMGLTRVFAELDLGYDYDWDQYKDS